MLSLRFSESKIEAGCDEAGRGCLAGPVFAAAVILPDDFSCTELNDSKKLSEKKRYQLKPYIEANATAFAVAMIDNKKIDKINILNAAILAMHKAIDNLKVKPELLLIDGNRFHSYKKIEYKCIIKGDAKYMSIAAASVLAKTYRDDYMKLLHEQYPHYQWKKNKGYPTQLHREMIKNWGVTPYHRMSFTLIKE